jgi:hypothetical protein
MGMDWKDILLGFNLWQWQMEIMIQDCSIELESDLNDPQYSAL